MNVSEQGAIVIGRTHEVLCVGPYERLCSGARFLGRVHEGLCAGPYEH